MKISNLLIIIIFAVLISCDGHTGYQPQHLRKLTQHELMEKARNQTFYPDSIVYKDSLGKVVSKDDFFQLDFTTYTTDQYADSHDRVREIVIRRATKEDMELRSKLQAAYEEGPTLTLLEVDCTKIKEILAEVVEKDQANRQNNQVIDVKIDHQNQEQVISIIEKCGFPSSQNVGLSGINTIFLVIQHASMKLREKYFPLIKQSADRGELSWSSVALMEDRMLMDKGQKQKYGSQVTKKGNGTWMVHPIDDLVNVNKRRAQVGLGPIDEYLAQWNIEFKPQK
jgi:uncharacterized protein YqgV (UPF0045/DUF77 family)